MLCLGNGIYANAPRARDKGCVGDAQRYRSLWGIGIANALNLLSWKNRLDIHPITCYVENAIAPLPGGARPKSP